MGRLIRRKPNDYFAMFSQGAAISQRAARALEHALSSGNVDTEEMRAIKEIEHEGDTHVHRSLDEIEKAFITPFDSEKMADIVRGIENLTDAIDQISRHFYMMRIQTTDPFIEKFVALLIETTDHLVNLTNNMHDHKRHPDIVKQAIIEINHVENIGDQTYQQAVYELFDGTKDAIDVFRLHTLYDQLESALDVCEDIADNIETILITLS